MSAWVVHDEHIRVLIWAAQNTGRDFGWFYRKKWIYLTSNNAADVGKMLMKANVASVNYRYDEKSPSSYLHRKPKDKTWSVVEVLKSINCYRYQSCEYPGWGRSQAKVFCDALEGTLIRKLAGYEEAPWGISPITKSVVRA